MGWSFKWISSGDNGFNRDYGVAFTPEEVARKEAFYNFKVQDPAGNLFHTYSAYVRGIDLVNTAYNYLDLLPKRRDEEEHPNSVRHRDKYKD